jgi:hypothetical protein
MSRENTITLTHKELEEEIRRAFIRGQGNREMMMAGLERDETQDYTNHRMRALIGAASREELFLTRLLDTWNNYSLSEGKAGFRKQILGMLEEIKGPQSIKTQGQDLRESYKKETGREPIDNVYIEWLENKLS